MDFSPQFDRVQKYANTQKYVSTIKESSITGALAKTSLVSMIIFLCYMLIPNSAMINMVGVLPRTLEFSQLFAIFGSWLSHANTGHLMGNMTTMLIPLFFFFTQVRRRSAFLWFMLLVGTSGFFTWLLAAPGTVTIGASGLAYALFGFILASTFRSFWCFLASIITLALFIFPMIAGLIPQEAVSWAGHAGGALAGLIMGRHFTKVNTGDDFYYKQTLKDRIKNKWETFRS